MSVALEQRIVTITSCDVTEDHLPAFGWLPSADLRIGVLQNQWLTKSISFGLDQTDSKRIV
jgi:hypothetical protein